MRFTYFKKILLMLLVGSALNCVALAQQQGADNAQVNVTFSVFTMNAAGLDRIFYMDSRQTPQQLRFRAGSKSQAYEYSGSDTITFFDYMGTVGQKDFQAMPKATAKIPRGAEKLIFFFFPNSAGSNMPFRVFVFDDSERAFPYQSAVVFNLSGRNLLMNQGNRLQAIRQGPMAPLGLRNGEGRFQFYYEVDGKRFLSLNEVYRCSPRERIIIILLPPARPTSSQVRVRIIRDIKPLEEVQPAVPGQGDRGASRT